MQLIDIGASGGLNQNWSPARKYLHLIGFEPDQEAFEDLQNKASDATTYFNIGLYSQPTTLNFHVTRKQRCSSIFEPNRAFLNQFVRSERFDILKTVTLKADTLDHVLNLKQIEDIDFIKIDTQGSELFILQGGESTLRKSVFGLEIEVSFTEMYQGQPHFSDVDRYLRENNYHLFDVHPHYEKRSIGVNFGKPKGQLLFADALYLRDTGSFETVLRNIPNLIQKRSKLLRALTICFLYGYYDFALQILSSFSDIFDHQELTTIQNKIHQNIHLRRKIPQFPGRKEIAGLFSRLWDIFEPKYGKCTVVGDFIGNL